MIRKSSRMAILDEGVLASAHARALDIRGSGISVVVGSDIATITSIGGSPLLATYTPSAAASVDITSVISASYGTYDIFVDLGVSADDTEIWMRTDTANGASFDAGASDYAYNYSLQSTDAAPAATSAGDTKLVLTSSATHRVGNGTGERFTAWVVIQSVGSASAFPAVSAVGGYIQALNGIIVRLAGYGVRLSAAAINAVQILPSTGTITGAVRVYGRQTAP